MSDQAWIGILAAAVVLLCLQQFVPGTRSRRIRERAEQGRVSAELWGPCPINLLRGRLSGDGWTVAVPFPIPDPCFNRTCQHTSEDSWAVDYAARAQRMVWKVEGGQTLQGLEPLMTAMYEEAKAHGR